MIWYVGNDLIPVSKLSLFPVIRNAIWIAYHAETDLALLLEYLGFDIQGQVVLDVVAVEVDVYLLSFGVRIKRAEEVSEVIQWLPILVNSIDLEYFSLEIDVGPSSKSELWYLNFESLHELFNDLMAVGMDLQCG